MRILGMDPSLTNYGWSLVEYKDGSLVQLIDRGRIRTAPGQFPDMVDRYTHMREQVRELLQRTKPDACGIESTVFSTRAYFTEGLFALFIMSLEAIKAESKDLVLFAPLQVKSYAKTLIDRPSWWKMEKADMVEVSKALSEGLDLSKDVKGRPRKWDHNEADAFIISLYAARFWSVVYGHIPPSAMTEHEHKVFLGGRTKKAIDRSKGILFQEHARHYRWGKDIEHRGLPTADTIAEEAKTAAKSTPSAKTKASKASKASKVSNHGITSEEDLKQQIQEGLHDLEAFLAVGAGTRDPE